MSQNSTAEKPSVLNRILDALKDIFAPNLVALTAAGLTQALTIILHTMGLIQEGKAEYIILDTISGAVFYFLPILLANSSAKVFGATPALSMSAAAFLVHPTITQTFSDNYVMADFFGLPLPPGNYPNSVIPIILIVWAQSYIEKFFNKIIPDVVKGILNPVLILITTVLVGLVFLGPIGTFLGDGLVTIISFLNNTLPWLVPTLLGGFGIFVVMTGAHYSLFPVVTQMLSSIGYDSFFNPGMLASNLAIAGAVFAVVFKTKSSSYRQYAISATLTAALGVSQPALYGVAIPMKRVLIASIIGGLAGGFYAGLMNVYAFAFVNPGLAALPAYISPDGSANLIHAIITIIISFAVGFAIVFFQPYEDLPESEIAEIAETEQQ